MRSRLSPNPMTLDRGHTGCPQGLGTLSPNHRGASLEVPGLPLLPAAHLPGPPAHASSRGPCRQGARTPLCKSPKCWEGPNRRHPSSS